MPSTATVVSVLALLAAPAAAFRSTPSMVFGGLKRGKSPPVPEIPEQDKPLTDRIVGACEPFADGFDPLSFSKRANKADLVKFREAELKHGRVAMLALPGFLLSEDFHPFFPDLPKWEFSLFAFQDTLEKPVEEPLLLLSLLVIGAIESITIKKSGWSVPEGELGAKDSTFFKMNEDWTPGAYFVRGPWAPENLSEEEFAKKQLSELNNGRLAMISILLVVLQEAITKLPAEELDASLFGIN
mmetsp:Transcript_28657/g.83799  ORF Transcript_28657/g.83799 Transcript_28657/m.83799 type:complete len:242 (-) Transcript_28657:304-1029(-)